MNKELQTLQTTVTELIKDGTDITAIFKYLSERVGNGITRLLIVQSALDLGVNKETVKTYLANFE